MAIGAYAMAILTVNAGFSFWLALPISMLITMLFGLLVGLPSLRLRADYFAIATIASAELIRLVAQNAAVAHRRQPGPLLHTTTQSTCFDDTWVKRLRHDQRLVRGPRAGTTRHRWRRCLIVVWIVASCVVTVALVLDPEARPWGRVLRAIREDEDAARALGKNAFAYKLQSLAIAAAIGSRSPAGSWRSNLATIHPTDYEPHRDLLRLRRAAARRPRQLLGRRRSARSSSGRCWRGPDSSTSSRTSQQTARASLRDRRRSC